ncbi:cytochrome P450 [Heliocybe sulcata]|uniref:Cytochrome P450 n=1 Tax=Heliocybe sulcata TaxID=5364 RepID=A0A5C3N9N3_9AGAM|nr:cytochrome P450 [Heliocybe sulcata]
MISTELLLQCAIAGLCILLTISFARARGDKLSFLPYPPGPKPLPIVGNAFQLPQKMPWKTYAQWGKEYGDLIHFTAFGQHIIVINSAKVANDLFERRSNIYSDKPHVPMVNLTGWDYVIGFMPYSDRWRQHRRYFHQVFRPQQAVKYNDTIRRKVRDLLRRLRNDPDGFGDHTKYWATDNIMSTVYGYDLDPKGDGFIELAENAMTMLSHAVFPGTFLVNSLPSLGYLPDWCPGTGFKRYGRQCSEMTTAIQEVPYKITKERMEQSGPFPCVTSDLIKRSIASGRMNAEEEGVIKRVAGVAYAAGSDTSASALQTAILAMVVYPGAKCKAQAELDAVVGNSRLPDFDDRELLPYTEAFFREVLRWQPVTPLALAHATSSDDVYEGYYIPAGATVFGNSWAILHDERTYEDPEEFRPERFLHTDGTLTDKFPMSAFGFGRRICPGRHVADASVWAAIASVLSAFDVQKATDDAGREIPVKVEYTDGLLSHPLPFKCRIVPRKDASVGTI